MKLARAGKLRISHSLLYSWIKGDAMMAIDTYFHIETDNLSNAIKEGLASHLDLADYINRHSQFPSEGFINLKLNNPKPEKEVVVSYSEQFDLKCIFDVLDEPVIYEYKTGRTDAMVWASTYQLPIYFLVAEIAGIEVDRAYIIHRNQHTQETNWVLVWNSAKKRQKARDYIDSYAPEIYEFFAQEGLI